MSQTDTNGTGRRDAGDQLSYAYVVHNTGNTDLHDVVVSDPSATAAVSCPRTTLVAGATLNCTSVSRLTQADLDATSVTRAAASVTAHDPASASVSASSAPSSPVLREIVGLNATQWFSLARDRNQNGRVDAGDAVVFRMAVVNSGNVSVHGIAVSDSLLARYGLTMSCSPTALSPGQKTSCVSPTFTVTNSAAVRGVLVNWATPSAVSARGTSFVSATTNVTFPVGVKSTTTDVPGGTTTTTTTTGVTPTPRTIRKMTLTQFRLSYDDVNGNGAFTAGETFKLGFTAANTGNTTLYGLTIVDDRLVKSKTAVTCATTTLAPGASTTCQSDAISITDFQGKVDAGYGTSFAYATARDAANVAVRSNSTQLYQGYFISDIRTTALPVTGSQSQVVVTSGLGLVGAGGLVFLLSRMSPRLLRRTRPEVGESGKLTGESGKPTTGPAV
ncbi:hypothetical protein [Lapillicoccus sp.]|uniref:DUF7507 domain-containing protein n=1 Tax=Lapillicoccus sp. TaxID=1909287 RepID=UPI003267337A